LLQEVAEVIAPLGLRLVADKTRVVHIDDGFDFLGHTIVRRVKRGTSKTYVFTFPSAKAMQAIRNRTRELTKSRSTLYMDLDEVLLRLSRSLRGWANYFRHGSSSRHFQQIDELRRRFTGPGSRFAYHGVTFHGASSVTIVRYRHRGTKIPTPWAINPASHAD
jgi:RNA-directed DNA polymerase